MLYTRIGWPLILVGRGPRPQQHVPLRQRGGRASVRQPGLERSRPRRSLLFVGWVTATLVEAKSGDDPHSPLWPRIKATVSDPSPSPRLVFPPPLSTFSAIQGSVRFTFNRPPSPSPQESPRIRQHLVTPDKRTHPNNTPQFPLEKACQDTPQSATRVRPTRGAGRGRQKSHGRRTTAYRARRDGRRRGPSRR